MAIRINTNLASLNAQNNLSKTNSTLAKTLERLSSGLRINRAADDAAGLAVAEKLRTQVKGFAQASNNTQDATNLISTAESGIDQISSILQRMRELSIQSANDTLVNTDRNKIQVEIDQLRDEITRIAENTEFNTRKLLDGSIQQSSASEDSNIEIKKNTRITNVSTGNLTDLITAVSIDGDAEQDLAVQLTVMKSDGQIAMFDGFIPTDDRMVIEVRTSEGIVGYSDIFNPIDLTSGAYSSVDFGITFSAGGSNAEITLELNPSALLATTDMGKTAMIQITAQRAAVTSDNALTFHIGANEGQTLRMGVQDLRANALRVETLNLVGINDNDSRLKAQNAIGVIDDALDFVNMTRARLGAYQNRLEYNLQNIQIAKENLTASESRIRDADIASETANLTRAQILVQAGTAVLTQANISPQSALSLLG